ncbi:MAG TPA: toprim domain-containing protein, partial [Spirochaetota bacterium]|nr:toprim domain-containing protein [Spirochaetota bacterium]
NNLLSSLKNMRQKTGFCSVCGLLSEQDPCRVCRSSARDRQTICVVKNVRDALIIERSGTYNGLYHVLGKLISPVNDIYEKDLPVEKLLNRLTAQTAEIIFALEHTVEAEATIKAIVKYLGGYKLKTTRVAIGIPIGTGLEFIDDDTMQRSLNNRISI